MTVRGAGARRGGVTRLLLALAAMAMLAACAGTPRTAPVAPPPAAQPAPQTPATPEGPADAVAAGVVPVGPFAVPEGAGRALTAFAASCPALLKRTDLSGLTTAADWRPACAAASTWPAADAAGFFARYFEAVRIGDGAAFATGYFEPEIAGSRTRQPGYDTPVYRRPPDLIEADLGQFADTLRGRKIRGRVVKGALVPYPDRAAIEDGAIAGKGLELAWAADPIDLFFLEVQGSGRLRLPDGGVMRIGYDGQNGRDYTAIGRVMRQRGLIQPPNTGMAAITAYLRANPAEGRAIMRENRSYVFFRELTGPGPLGAMNVAVTPRGTVAADPAFVPLGAPVLLAMDEPRASGLWVAQDTGGAIRGVNRFDTFWGAGEEAKAIAGNLSTRGRALLLLPKGVAARVSGEAPRR